MNKQIDCSNTDHTTLTTLITETVSDLTDISVEQLPLLYDSIDPDALEQLFQHDHNQMLKLQFQYHDFKITVDSAGTVTFEEIN